MPSTKALLLFLGATALAAGGALFGSAWATSAGCAVALGVIAQGVMARSVTTIEPAVATPGLPRPTRLLLYGAVLLLALAIVVEAQGWMASPIGDTPPTTDELIALLAETARQRTPFVRQLAVASCLILACVILGVVLARLPRKRLRRIGQVAPAVGALTLVTLAFVVLLPEGLSTVLGSASNVVLAAALVLGGYGWIVGRVIRRQGAAAIAAIGATVLAAEAWLAADHAGRRWPTPGGSDALLQPGISVAVAVKSGPDFETAINVAALLVGAALTVLACARLSRAESTVD
jgi:hypothetical protein